MFPGTLTVSIKQFSIKVERC